MIDRPQRAAFIFSQILFACFIGLLPIGSVYARDISFSETVALSGSDRRASNHIAVLAWDTTTSGYSVFVEDTESGSEIQKISFGNIEPIGIEVVPDTGGSQGDDIAVLYISEFGEHKARVIDAELGLLLREIDFAPAYIPMDLAVIDNVGGGVPGVVMLGVDDLGEVRAQIKQATDGSLVNFVQFAPNFPPKLLRIVPDVTGNGIDDLVVLGIDVLGNIRAQVKDPLTGALLHWIQFGRDFPPVDMIVVPNINGAGAPALALLGVHADGRVRAQVKRVDTREQINFVNFAQAYLPVAFASAGDITGDDVDEIAVLGINGSGDVRAQLKNPVTRAQVNVVSFANSYTPMDFLSPGDLGSDFGPDLTVLGLNVNGFYRLQSKDAVTKTASSTIQVVLAPVLSVADAQLIEGDVGETNLQFPVSVTVAAQDSGSTANFEFATVDGTAIAGEDYVAESGAQGIPIGLLNSFIAVKINGDVIDESDEAFDLVLSQPDNAILVSSGSSASGTILDDDGAAVLRVNPAALIEGDAGSTTLSFDVTLTPQAAQPVNVDYQTTDGTAQAGSDYTATNGTLTFVPGDTLENIDVTVFGDLTSEFNETFDVDLSNPVNAVIGQGSVQGTINNNDPLPTVSISDAGSINESQAGITDFTFTVSLSSVSGRTVTVNFQTSDGTATEDSDYTQTAGQLTFVPGDTIETVDVVLLDDNLDENIESFTMTLSNAIEAAIADGSGSASIIPDNDPQPSISISGGSITEGNSGSQNLQFAVSLSAVSGKTITVDYQTADETAVAGADYSNTNGSLQFDPGESQKTIDVPVLGDTIDEFTETFAVNLLNNVNVVIGTGSDQGTITDNDAPPSISIGDASTSEGNSGSKNLGFNVTLSAPSGKDISVQYDTADGTAVAGQDYVAVVGQQLDFPAGDTAKVINIQILGDLDEENNETFSVNLSVPSNVTIADGQGGGTINDDDGAAGQPGLDSRPSNLTCIAPEAPDPGASIKLTRVFQSAGGFSNMTALIQIPGDNSHWYVLEKSGRVKRFANVASPATASTALSITGPVNTSHNEAGLLGMAFHPNFGQTGMPHNDEVFISYTGNGTPIESRISRFTSSDGGTTIDAGSEEILLRVDQDAGNHNGGTIDFDQNGYLVAGFGDGGNGGDPNNNAQTTTNLLGAFIRIDVDGGSPYGIPSDNIFEGNQLCNANGFSPNATDCPEIYAYGMRNPWKWSFDRQTWVLWAGDVGQDVWEEVDVIENGGNYGWRFREGAHCFNPPNNCPTAGLIDPVAEYNQSNGDRTIIGGYVYRGTNIPDLFGVFVFGDTGTGRIWGLFDDGQGGLDRQELHNSPHTITTFAQDQNGEVYVNHYGSGAIYRIDKGTGGGATQTVEPNLSDTGCVLNNDPTTPETGLIPFDINAPFWSDFAVKERWIAIPNDTTIDINGDDDFVFPIGTVLMKNFELGGTLIETRLFMLHTDGTPDGTWGGYSYEWNQAGDDATLVVGGKVKNINNQDWIYPSGTACLSCHTDVAGRSLGPEISQLNKDFLYVETGRTDNQLNTFDAIGMFTNPLPNPDTLPKLPDPFGAAPLEDRARAYMHTNCSQCHRLNGPTPANMDLRYSTAFIDTDTCNVDPTSGDLGLNDPKLIKPMDPANSMIIYRMSRRDVHGMPPLGSDLSDPAGEQLLTDWVMSLISGCP